MQDVRSLNHKRYENEESTYDTGDTLYASAPNTLSKLAIGGVGEVLTVAGGVPTWAAGGSYVALDSSLTSTSAGFGSRQIPLVINSSIGFVVSEAGLECTISGDYSITGSASVTTAQAGEIGCSVDINSTDVVFDNQIVWQGETKRFNVTMVISMTSGDVITFLLNAGDKFGGSAEANSIIAPTRFSIVKI